MSVYFITARSVGMVKIGCAYNPRARLNSIRTASPVEVELEAMLAGSFDEEKEIHARFKHLRVRGEWFTLSPELEAIIAANPPPKTKSTQLFLKRAREMQGKRSKYAPEVSQRLSRDAKRYAAAMADMRAEQERSLRLEAPE